MQNAAASDAEIIRTREYAMNPHRRRMLALAEQPNRADWTAFVDGLDGGIAPLPAEPSTEWQLIHGRPINPNHRAAPTLDPTLAPKRKAPTLSNPRPAPPAPPAPVAASPRSADLLSVVERRSESIRSFLAECEQECAHLEATNEARRALGSHNMVAWPALQGLTNTATHRAAPSLQRRAPKASGGPPIAPAWRKAPTASNAQRRPSPPRPPPPPRPPRRDAFFLKRQFTIITLTDGRTIRVLKKDAPIVPPPKPFVKAKAK